MNAVIQVVGTGYGGILWEVYLISKTLCGNRIVEVMEFERLAGVGQVEGMGCDFQGKYIQRTMCVITQEAMCH